MWSYLHFTILAEEPGSIPRLGRSPGEGIGCPLQYSWPSLVAQLVKNLPCNAGYLGLIPGLGRSPGEGKGYLLQYSGLEHSIDCTVQSVQFSHSVMSNSLWSHGLQHARLPCPSPTLKACSNSCPSSTWCHPNISSSVIPFSSCLQSCPASGSSPMSQFFPWGGQSTGVSASASVLPMNTQDWSPLGWTGWISLQSKGLKRLLQHHSSKASIPQHSAFFIVQLSHPYMTTGKTTALTRQPLSAK